MEDLRYQLDLLDAMNQKLITDEKMYQMMVETSNSGFIYYNFKTNKVRTLGNWEHFFGFHFRELRDFDLLYEQVEDRFVPTLRDAIEIHKQGLEKSTVQVRLKESGMWISVEVTVVYNFDVPTDRIIRIMDVTKINQQQEELTYMAYYDSLTGLYNRNYFVRLLSDFIVEAEKNHRMVSVMFLDIDDFRKINDSLGIVMGDDLVCQFGHFLSELSSNNVIISHFNSDIFCIAVYDSDNGDQVKDIYSKIQYRNQSPYVLGTGTEVKVTVSVGVAEYPDASKDPLELINCAEIVMFKAKEKGKNTIQFFDAPILQEFLHSVEIENKLKAAVFNQNFMMYFQPQYTIKGGRLRGVEALIRWRDDDGHMISPATFIPIAESNGAIVPIGNWIIEDSIRRYVEWQNKYDIHFALSLNISAIQYKQPDFVENIVGALQRYRMDPKNLELEITESVLIGDYKEITDKLVILRDYGIRISLDDFGTGYSSLSYLKGLPIDTLKIDKSFIDTITTDENTKIIMESILFMAGRLGLETIAEGVEDKQQYEYLDSVGCDIIQGFYLGRPVPSNELETIIAKHINE